MLEHITLDAILKDYYYMINSENLSEDKIVIDDTLEVTDSSIKYIIRFATFLNDAYYKGYIIHPSILKKLMDVIEYSGYEYQVIECYISILNKSMNDYNIAPECKPDYDKLNLNGENCKNFINQYIKIMQDFYNEITIDNIPHFKNPEIIEPEHDLFILREVEDPIDLLFNDLDNGVYDIKKQTDILYYLYKTDKFPYAPEIINKYIKSPSLFFLLNEENYSSIDICINNINTFNDLSIYINTFYNYTDQNEPFPEIMIKNIRRIIDILTINMCKQQLAQIVGLDWEFWNDVSIKINNPVKLYDALSLYKRFTNEYKIYNPVELLSKLNTFYGNDMYFYARYIVLNMDYRLFCDNFYIIIENLYDNFTNGECYDLISECIDGLIKLSNDNVKNRLIELSDNIKEYIRKDDISEDIIHLCEYTMDTISDYTK